MEFIWRAILPILALGSGTFLGVRRPVHGIAVLVALLVPTSSLPWQLGLPNLALGLLFSIGLICGTLLTEDGRCVWYRSNEVSPSLRALAIATVGCIALSTLVFAARALALAGDAGDIHPASWLDATLFSPQGAAGRLHAVLIALSGPALFFLAAGAIRSEDERRFVCRAWVVGLALTIVTPLLQLAAGLPPDVRPDQGTTTGTGFVAFFQDPHSLAAYLLLGYSLCAGAALGFAAARRWAAVGYTVLGCGVLGLVLLSNSRAGLIMAMLATLAIIMSLPRIATPPGAKANTAALLASWIIVSCLVLLAIWPQARTVAWNQLRKTPADRAAELFNPEQSPLQLLETRRQMWSKALYLAGAHPLWGIGPAGMTRTGVVVVDTGTNTVSPQMLYENAHNQFLQNAAEYGLPATLCLVLLLGAILLSVVRRGVQATRTENRGLILGVAAGQVSFLAFALFSHPLLIAEVQAAYWILAAVAAISTDS